MTGNDGIEGIFSTELSFEYETMTLQTAPSHAHLALREGETLFGRYKYICKLGEGGMGSVHLVRDQMTRGLFALKLIAPGRDSPDARARFRREITIQRRFLHPNIVGVHDFGMPEGERIGYVAMNYVDGPNLEELIAASGPLASGSLIAMVEQISTALEVIHGVGILHRDIKPSNIIVATPSDGCPIFKLGDFGIAKDLMALDGSFYTRSNCIVGTPFYLAPEIFYGVEPSRRSDLYSFALVVARAATGMPAQDVLAWLPEADTISLPYLSSGASSVLARALSATPSDRYEFAADFGRRFLSSL